MKTTVEITDALLQEAKDVAERDGTTLRALVEDGLRRVLAERLLAGEPFHLRDAAFRGGRGLRPEFRDAPWEQILAAIYEGRG